MCGSHYSTWHRRTHGRGDAIFTNTCIQCGAQWETRRADAKYCSVQCKGEAYRRICKLPSDHVVTVAIAELRRIERDARAAEQVAAQRSRFEWRTPRECPGCACWFTPLYTSTTVTCSRPCARRCAKRRRRAREHGARGSWTWSEFMRIAKKFNYCCAYCGERPERLDPDHVVPLSRGGYDSPSNLLPACLMCNSSKCAMTLGEWELWLELRALPSRATTWDADDRRYWHLTQAMLESVA